MNILLLHGMGNPRKWLRSVATFELGLPKLAPHHNYLIHNTSLPLPDFAKRFPFDMILINSSVLTSVFDRSRLQTLKSDYGFIRDSTAFKIALPQDDYYCSEELDQLVTEWKVDLLYTVCPQYWDILYPKFIASGKTIRLGFTGYVTPEMKDKSILIKTDEERKFDVTYRASGIPSFPNKLALVKARLGDIFLENIRFTEGNFNIASGKGTMISGAAWWDFIENSRCVLGSLSGSSSLIRNHAISDRIKEYRARNPDATNDELVDHCLSADDTSRVYEAISPRVIEAGLLGSVQLLVPGQYSNIFVAYEDYFPIQGDLLQGGKQISNKEEILELLKDRSLRKKIATTCKKKIADTQEIHLDFFFKSIFETYNLRMKKNLKTDRSFQFMKIKYDLLMTPMYTSKFFVGNAIYSIKGGR